MKVQNLYNEKFKYLKNEIEKWRDSSCSWICRINIVKLTNLSKALCSFSGISIKIPNNILHRNRKKIPSKIHMAPENPQIARVIQNKKKTEGNIIQELQVIL